MNELAAKAHSAADSFNMERQIETLKLNNTIATSTFCRRFSYND